MTSGCKTLANCSTSENALIKVSEGGEGILEGLDAIDAPPKSLARLVVRLVRVMRVRVEACTMCI